MHNIIQVFSGCGSYESEVQKFAFSFKMSRIIGMIGSKGLAQLASNLHLLT